MNSREREVSKIYHLSWIFPILDFVTNAKLNWRAGCITALCLILGRFSIFLRFVRSSACELQFDWKTLSRFFFGRFVFRIREITYAKNCVFHCVHKEIDNAFSPGDNYSFHESDLQITVRLLNSWLRKHSCFAYVISRIRNTNRPKKKLDNVFQSNCSSHAELLTNLRKIEKRPKIRHKAVMHPALQLRYNKGLKMGMDFRGQV